AVPYQQLATTTSSLSDPLVGAVVPLPLHDALPICARSVPSRISTSAIGSTPSAISRSSGVPASARSGPNTPRISGAPATTTPTRSEEHTSELQSRENLVCRLQLENKTHISQLSHEQ